MVVCEPCWPGGPRSMKWSSAPLPLGHWLTVEASPLHGVSRVAGFCVSAALPAPLLSPSPSLKPHHPGGGMQRAAPRAEAGSGSSGLLAPEFTAR